MMHNATMEICTTTSIVRRYLLGESFKSVLIRLTIILSSIGVVWSGIMLALVIHTKYQRSKQMLKSSMTHHHLCDSITSLNNKQSNRSKRNRLYDSTSASTSLCCYRIRRFLSYLVEYCIFCSSSSPSMDNEISKAESSPPIRRKSQAEPSFMPMYPHPPSSKVQLVIESMTGRPLYRNKNILKIGKKISLYRESESLSGDEFRSFHTNDYGRKSSIEVNTNTSDFVQQVVQFLLNFLDYLLIFVFFFRENQIIMINVLQFHSKMTKTQMLVKQQKFYQAYKNTIQK